MAREAGRNDDDGVPQGTHECGNWIAAQFPLTHVA